jgi:hypothetical protein
MMKHWGKDTAFDDDSIVYDTTVYDDDESTHAKHKRSADDTTKSRTSQSGPRQLEELENAGGINIHRIELTEEAKIFSSIFDDLRASTWSAATEHYVTTMATKRVIYSHLDATIIKAATQQKAIRNANRGEAKMYIHAFVIAKMSGLGRLIGHPQLQNAATQASRKLRLAGTHTLLLEIQEIISINNACYSFESDFKNYFPQIPLPTETQPFFAIANVDEKRNITFHLMKVLVQGWNRSTQIAQTISLLALCHGDRQMTNEIERHVDIPGLIVYEHEGGRTLIAIVYDNILCVSSSQQQRDRILAQLKKNANAWNIRFKYINKSDNEINFCGIQFRANTSSKLQWRIDPKVTTKWKATAQLPQTTPRHAMKRYGYASRLAHIRLTPTAELRTTTKHIANLCRKMIETEHKNWNLSNESTASIIITALKQQIMDIEDDWSEFQDMPAAKTLIVFTDASTTRLGFVFIAEDEIRHGTIVRKNDEHIDIAEAQAVTWALQFLHEEIKTQKEKGLENIVIGIDNTAAGRAILKGFSPSDDLNEEVCRTLLEITKSFNLNNVLICDIESESNVADVMTRTCDISTEDYNTRLVISRARAEQTRINGTKGVRWTARKPKTRTKQQDAGEQAKQQTAILS